MSLHEQLPTGAARFVGRVGALAVALGIGVAVANSPGIAFAAPGDANGSASGASGASAGASNGAGSGAGSAGAAGGHIAGRGDKQQSGTDGKSNAGKGTKDKGPSADSGKSDGSKADKSSAQAGAAPDSSQGQASSSGQSATAKPHKGGSGNGGASTDSTGTAAGDQGAQGAKQAGVLNSGKKSTHPTAADTAAKPSSSATPDSTDTGKTPASTAPKPATAVAGQDVSATPASAAPIASAEPVQKAASAPVAAAESPVANVGSLLSDVLSAVGLNAGASANASGNPAAPLQDAVASAVLGATRKETEASSTTTTLAAAPTSVPSTASVLGTSQQLTAEQNANAIVNTLPMQIVKTILGWVFHFDANRQFSQVGGPDQTNLDQLGNAVNEYAQQAAMEYQLLDSMNPTVLEMVMPPHDWFGQAVTGTRILYDNPDTIYRMMGVNAASTYVITGKFAPGEMPAETTFSVLTGLGGTTAAVLNAKDMQINPDGSFAITVGSAPAAAGQTNYLQIPTNTTLIVARNTLSDWNTQAPMSLSIQRVGGPPDSLFAQIGGFAIPGLGSIVAGNQLLTNLVSLVPPLPVMPTILQGLEASVVLALGLQMEPQYMAVATQDSSGKQKAPNVFTDPASNATFLSTQVQSPGYFELTNQQALVLTINPGDAGYFVVPVTNDWTITNNYWDQQTSLNIAQSVANPDGTYTIVVSPTDPGVANWVSTGGLNQGTISIRFQDIVPTGTDSPTVSSQVVSLDDLSSVLPAGTVYVTPAERQEAIDQRKAGFNSRFAPYSQV